MEMTTRALLYFAIAHEKEQGHVPSMDLREIPHERMELIKRVIPIVVENQQGVVGDIAQVPVPYTYQVAGTSGIFGAGARVTENGETTVAGLFAAGTCTDMTYLPGGNLPFCSVTGDWAGRAAGAKARSTPVESPLREQVDAIARGIHEPLEQKSGVDFDTVHRRLGRLLMDKIGLVLHADRIGSALSELREMRHNEIPRLMAGDAHELAKVWGLRQYAQVLEATLEAYRYRTESRVAFIREDFPIIDNVNWVKMVIAKLENGALRLWDEPLPESYHDPIPVRPTQNLHLVFRNKEPSGAAR
jgi:succinate dehydrogenase/fumarate reductase flavoprotein subunit